MITMVDYAFPRLNGGARLNRLSRGNDRDNGRGGVGWRWAVASLKKAWPPRKDSRRLAQLKRQLTRRYALSREGEGANYRGGFDKSSHFERKFSIVPGTDGWKGIRDADTKEVYFSFSIGSCNLNDN